MFEPTLIAPSILSADFMNLDHDVEMVKQAGCDLLHIDVMDGHFVPNLTIGPPHVKALKETIELPLDVHLMIDNPDVQIPWYIDAGADSITVHIETLSDPEATIASIHDGGCKAALSLNPPTDVQDVLDYLDLVDMVLVMSVNPGFSGQSFIPSSVEKVEAISNHLKMIGSTCRIQVDGGINRKTAMLVAEKGADVLVSGNSVFGAEDPAAAIDAIRTCAESARLQALGEFTK